MRTRAAVADVEPLNEEMPGQPRQSASLPWRRDIDVQFERRRAVERSRDGADESRDAKRASAIRCVTAKSLNSKDCDAGDANGAKSGL